MSNTTPSMSPATATPLKANAERLRDLFRVAVERDLPEMATAARRVLRAWAEAEAAILAARRSGEPGAADLPSAEAFRVRPYLPREEASRERVVRWCGRDRQPLHGMSDERPDFRVPPPRGAECAEFGRITYREAQERVDLPALSESLSVPADIAGGNVGWEPIKHLGPVEVLALLDRLDAGYVSVPAGQAETVEHVMLHRVFLQPIELAGASDPRGP